MPQRTPTASAQQIPAVIAADVPPNLSMTTAATIPERFAIPTSDKSIPPETIAIIMPNARIPYSGSWTSMLCRLAFPKNFGL